MGNLRLWINDVVLPTVGDYGATVGVYSSKPVYQGDHLVSAHDLTELGLIATAAGLATTYLATWDNVQQPIANAVVTANATMRLAPPNVNHWRALHGREVIVMNTGVWSADNLANTGPGVIAHFDVPSRTWMSGV